MSSRSFFGFIERLQHKSDREKDKIIFITVCVIMLFIIGIWLSFPGEDAREQNTQDQQAGPIRALWQEIKEHAPTFTP